MNQQRSAPAWRLVLLTSLDRYEDAGLLLLRCVTGGFLIYQSHDNIFSSDRMKEFEAFLDGFGFIYPQFMAPLSVGFQFLAGIAFVLGLFTRWFGLITAINFIVAVWMVHWTDPILGIWPAAILVFLGLYFGLRGAGRFGIDNHLQRAGPRQKERQGSFDPE